MIEYNGHTLTIERHFYQDELEETYFEVSNPDGTFCHLDWSGWGDAPTHDDFKLWVDLGKPTRDHPAINKYRAAKGYNVRCSVPLNREYLDAIFIEEMVKGLS
jgi:hypothetical protein